MVKLINSIKQTQQGRETRLTVTVDYDPRTYQIEIRSITVEEQKCYKSGNYVSYSPLSTSVDVTDLLLDQCPSIEEDIKRMNWEEVYAESKEGRAVA